MEASTSQTSSSPPPWTGLSSFGRPGEPQEKILIHGRGGQALVRRFNLHSCSKLVFYLTSKYWYHSWIWQICLWFVRERKELYSFEASGDYVMDVAWSPVNRKHQFWEKFNMLMLSTVDVCFCQRDGLVSGVISLFGVYSYMMMVSFVYVPPIFFTSFLPL